MSSCCWVSGECSCFLIAVTHKTILHLRLVTHRFFFSSSVHLSHDQFWATRDLSRRPRKSDVGDGINKNHAEKVCRNSRNEEAFVHYLHYSMRNAPITCLGRRFL